MQAVKDKLQDMNAMRKARAEAKAQEKVYETFENFFIGIFQIFNYI